MLPIAGVILLLVVVAVIAILIGHFGDKIGPRRGQDEPKRAIKSFKDQKKPFSKTFKTIFSLFF